MTSSILHILTDPKAMIAAVGTAGVIAIIFLETGAFFGFFFPGDSLLFTAGFLATQGYTSMVWLLVGAFLAAVIGDSVGYAFGKKVGPALFTREDSLFFNRRHIARAQHFFEKHGKKTIILARFIPIVRTFAPIVAGIGTMEYRTFLAYNVFGGLGWSWLMLWLGYGLGSLIPEPDRYVLPIILVIILVSFIPPIVEAVKHRRGRAVGLD
ncbi:MAG: VTT domain-containing protein [Patescibacteria group bacterium]|nr:VTT domain-containing protein [Patescibacteria group bacterium]MDE1940510.1 VTT domain-containing protein [Patescibacteria group bacterium]MDE1966576.1 VTT domain-containing protein [Patescibacteria group bacterium]